MLKFLLEKEFKQMFRDPLIARMLIALPVMMILIFPWAANQDIKNIKLSIVDNDKSTVSMRLINKLGNSDYFRLTDVSQSYSEAMESIELSDADIILEIESNFERNLVREGKSSVMISANSVNGTKGVLGSSYLVAMLQDYGNELREEAIGVQVKQTNSPVPMIEIIPQYRYNEHLDYKIFMVPAIMVILITLIVGFLPALNIVQEKEIGTIEQMNVSPVSKVLFILAKLIPYWVIGLFVLTITFILAAIIYGLTPSGSFLTLYFFTGIYILVTSGLGLVVSNNSSTMQQAMFVIFFFIMIFILTSGLFTPVPSMPNWAQNIAMFNPMKYFIEVMRMVFLKGSNILQLSQQLYALLAFALAFNIWAIISYRKSS